MQSSLAFRPYWLALGWAMVALVLYLSLARIPQGPPITHLDKLEHALAYFALSAWFYQLYPQRRLPAIALITLGGVIEVLQGFTGYREMSLADAAADALGIVLGWEYSRRNPKWLARAESWLHG